MYQRPERRRQLGQVNANSAFVNHSKMPPPPPPPQQFTQRRSAGSINGQPPSHIHSRPGHGPPPRSPGDASFGSATSSSSTPNLYGATNPHTSSSTQFAQPKQPTYPQHNPQNHYGEIHRKSTAGRSAGVSCGFFLLWTFLLAGGGYIYFHWFLVPNLVKDVRKEEVSQTKHHWMTKYHNLQLTHEALEKTHLELKQTAEAAIQAAEAAKASGGGDANMARELEETTNMLIQERTWAGEWKAKALGLEDQYNIVTQQIQEFSKKRLIQKYGYRTLAVEMELNFAEGDSAWITIELAPIDDMPHTVFTFLEQVDMGLYNDGGYAFHHNGEHIIMGAPVFNHLTPQDMDPAQRFADSGVKSVLFQEYSYNFPHYAYTVGFAGRPGGPDFYFNTQDNSALHGPGGYAEDGSADPCFGRVTRGTDIIDRIHGLTGDLAQGDWKEMGPYVAVRWIKILYEY